MPPPPLRPSQPTSRLWGLEDSSLPESFSLCSWARVLGNKYHQGMRDWVRLYWEITQPHLSLHLQKTNKTKNNQHAGYRKHNSPYSQSNHKNSCNFLIALCSSGVCMWCAYFPQPLKRQLSFILFQWAVSVSQDGVWVFFPQFLQCPPRCPRAYLP